MMGIVMELDKLNAEQIDDLIRKLSTMRKSMQPEIPRKLPEGEHKDMPVDPIWAVPSQRASQEKVLAIRHDGLVIVLSPSTGGSKTRKHTSP